MKLSASQLSLRLAKLYRAPFPKDKRLTLNAHNTGVAIRLVKAYLLRAFGMPLPGKIDSHFSAGRGAKGWELDAEKLLGLLEKATPVLASRELVDNTEVSQSDIDKLWDDKEVLEDISDDESLDGIFDDESAGGLSIRLERKDLLNDPMNC
jgi:hypothetical protein